MTNQRKPKTDFEKELEREAKAYESLFWLIPKWMRIISPTDMAMKMQLIEMKVEVRRIERLAKGDKTGWLQDTIYKMMLETWVYVWAFMMNFIGVVLILALNVLWFWFLGYVIYWMFTS